MDPAIQQASNFYYTTYIVDNPIFPSDQKITTLLPAGIVKIQIVATLIITAFVVGATTGLTIWCWLVIILETIVVAFIVYKNLLSKDPLVEVFYKIAGDKEAYNKLPEWALDTDKKTYENLQEVEWTELKHPVYRFTTLDGRKGMLIKELEERPAMTTPIQRVQCFVEKIDPYYDLPKLISNVSDRINYIFLATIGCLNGKNSFGRVIKQTILGGEERAKFAKEWIIHSSINTNRANSYVAQNGIVNEISPKIVEI